MDTATPEERDRIIRSAIATQALAGIVVTRETAERLFDEAWAEDEDALDARLLLPDASDLNSDPPPVG